MQTNHSLQDKLNQIGQQAKWASHQLTLLDTEQKNAMLKSLALILADKREAIKSANQKDCEQAKSKGLTDAMIDRLVLDDARINGMIEGVQQVANLPDPVGEIADMKNQTSGLKIGKMRIPIGVIGMIYESRPNVTIDAAILCFKSANAVILRGGSEAFHSNMVLVACLQEALVQNHCPSHAVQYIDTVDRAAVGVMIGLTQYIDVIIPRGGKSLTSRIDAESKVPVIKHLDGICHVYIDKFADKEKALAIAINAKTRRYGVCGAMETLLVDSAIAKNILPSLSSSLIEKGVELRISEVDKSYLSPEISAHSLIVTATDSDWTSEYLAPILSIKVVDGLNQAIEHINAFGSHHTDAIVTENLSHANQFVRSVDSSSVMVNASTQFADGFEYGLGAEIGISTNKLHVRGPVGLEGLTTQKYIVYGDGHVRPS